MTLSRIGLRLAVPQIANHSVQISKPPLLSKVAASLPSSRNGGALSSRVGNMNVMAAQRVAHRCLSIYTPIAKMEYQFPSKDKVLKHLEQHPCTQDLEFADPSVYLAIATAFGDKRKPLETIKTSVMLTLNRVNQDQNHRWPEPLLLLLTQNFDTALMELFGRRRA